MICDERREFELNLGKALDTLKKDYPDMLTKGPDFDIYTEDLDVVDPTGFKLHGLKNYKTFFQVLRSFISFFYCPESSGLTFRLVYDWARNSIRVSWNAILVPKLGGVRNRVHVDGISVYEVDRGTGMIVKHTVEHLLLNDRPVFAPKGIFHAVNYDLVPASGVPAGPIYNSRAATTPRRSTKLHMSSSSDDVGGSSSSSFDVVAFEKKNAARKKFGLAALTPEEFSRIEAEVRGLEMKTRQAAQSAAELSRQDLQKREKANFFSKMMEGVVKNGCESNFDCERPQVCCDLIVKKMCCSSGVGVYEPPLQRIPIRVPAATSNYPDRPGTM